MTAQMLREFSDLMEISGDTYRARAYARAAKSVIIGSKKGIGRSIRQKIDEFEATGRVQALEDLKQSPVIKAHRELGTIMGVGPSTISAWIDKGVFSVSTLHEAIERGTITLTRTQELGLKYHADLNKRIPRGDILRIVDNISRLVGIEFTIAGSYRRGKAESGDIDLIALNGNIANIVKKLSSSANFIPVNVGPSMTTFLWHDTEHPTPTMRQVDIITCTDNTFATTLLYFTGSWQFNEMMRGRAKSMGYKLNQNGLFKNGRLVPTPHEEDVFKVLGMAYVKPEDRI